MKYWLGLVLAVGLLVGVVNLIYQLGRLHERIDVLKVDTIPPTQSDGGIRDHRTTCSNGTSVWYARWDGYCYANEPDAQGFRKADLTVKTFIDRQRKLSMIPFRRMFTDPAKEGSACDATVEPWAGEWINNLTDTIWTCPGGSWVSTYAKDIGKEWRTQEAR